MRTPLNNIVAACGGKGGCNQIKGARMPSLEPGKDKWVPPNPTPDIEKKIGILDMVKKLFD